MIDAERREHITGRLRDYTRIAAELREKVTAANVKQELTRHIQTFGDLERLFLSFGTDSCRPEDVETLVLDSVELMARSALVRIRAVQERVATYGYDAKPVGE